MSKRLFLCLAVVSCLTRLDAYGQNGSMDDAEKKVVFYDASFLPVYGKASDATKTRYERLPADYEGRVREAVWNLGRNSSGLYVRFRSNSSSVSVRWTSMFCNSMNHMTDTGTRGLDLYIYSGEEWRFAGAARPEGKTTETVVVADMGRQDREYMLYLSLYDGIETLEIGVDEDAFIKAPESDSPASGHPAVMYGTSILQGGCASRPGMAYTSILGRRLDMEVINLGFSGNAFLDYEIAWLMASVPFPAVYVLDYVPNASAETIRERGKGFFRILRNAHPDVPVVFVEDPVFPHSVFDKAVEREVMRKNQAQKELFGFLRSSGEKRIYYISSDEMLGDDGEATVDGIHFTDLGSMRYVEHVMPVIEKAISDAADEI